MKQTVRKMIEMIEADGWEKQKQKGTSHRQFKHPTKKGKVTINGKLSHDLGDFLVNSIEKQAGLR